jgi:hypothetical protein
VDAGVCARHGCGNPLLPGRRLKSYCSYACRGQFRALEATGHRTGLKWSKNAKQNKALRSLKRQSVAGFSFAQINSCTYRLDRPNKFGAGWLMEVSPKSSQQRWVARFGSRASEPMTLDEAKRAAVAMLRERRKDEPREWIAELNRIAGAEVDRVALARERKQWPRDLLGGLRRGWMRIDRDQRNAILSAELFIPTAAEPLSGDEHEITYDVGGNVELPRCLERQKPKLSSKFPVTTKPQQLALPGPRKQESDLQ